VETVNLTAGTADDTINVGSTAARVNTNINANAGNDAVNIAVTGADSNVVVNGNGGDDEITLVATGGDTAQDMDSNGAFTVLNGDEGMDTIDIRTTALGSFTRANGGDDNDEINIGNPVGGGLFSLDGIDGTVVVVGGDNGAATRSVRSSLELTPAGALTCDTTFQFGNTAVATGDTLNVLDTAQTTGQRYDITINAVVRDGGPAIVRQEVETINLETGSGNDQVLAILPERGSPPPMNAPPVFLPLGAVITIDTNGSNMGQDFVEIRGTTGNDTILVGPDAPDPNALTPNVWPFEIRDVEFLRVRGRGGADHIGNETSTPSLLEGGEVNDPVGPPSPPMPTTADIEDILVGGTGNDTLVGGSGIDALFGREGNDVLFSDADVGSETDPNNPQDTQDEVEFRDNGDLLNGGPQTPTPTVVGDAAAQFGTNDQVCNVERLLDGGARKDVLTWLRAIIGDVVLDFPNVPFNPQEPLEPLDDSEDLGLDLADVLPPEPALFAAPAGEGEAEGSFDLDSSSNIDDVLDAIARDIAASSLRSSLGENGGK
jgi:hypothetical protein